MKGKLPAAHRRQLFIADYIVHRDSHRAALAAGFSKRSAKQQGSRLLGRPDVAEAIAKKLKKIADACEVSAARIIQEYARIAFVDVKNLFDDDGNILPLRDMDEDARRVISGIEVEERHEGSGDDVQVYHVRKIKLSDKIRALDSLADIHKMFPSSSNVVVTGPNGGPIEVSTDEGKLELARRVCFLLRSATEAAKPQGKANGTR